MKLGWAAAAAANTNVVKHQMSERTGGYCQRSLGDATTRRAGRRALDIRIQPFVGPAFEWHAIVLLVKSNHLAAFLVAFNLFLPHAAPAADCPSDRFALWNIGVLRGANVFQGRNPGGASNGIGDGDFAQSDFDQLAAAGANYVQISHAGIFAETPPYALDGDAQANLDRVVGMASAAGLYAVIAFRSGPGRNENAISNRDGTLRGADLDGRGGARRVGGDASSCRGPLRRQSGGRRPVGDGRAERVRAARLHRSG